MQSIRTIGRTESHTLTVPHLLEIRAAELGDAVAFRGVDGDLTYGAWMAQAVRLAEMMRTELGVRCGDRVFLWFGNDGASAYWTSYVATGLLGAITVSLDDRLSMREVNRLIAEAAPSAMIVSGRLSSNLGADSESAEPTNADAVLYCSSIPGLGMTPRLRFTLNRADLGVATQVTIDARPDQVASIAYTSGTTGRPKGVKQGGLVPYMERVANEIWALPRRGAPVTAEDVIQSPIPTYTAPYNVLTAVFAGARAVLEGRRFDPRLSERLIASEGTTIYNGAPAHYLMMSEAELPSDGPPRRLSLLVSGGSGFSKAVHERMQARWPGAAIVNWYGLNECGNLIHFGEDLRRNPTAIGRPISGVDVKVLAADGSMAAPGEPGELCISDGAFLGYFNRPDLDREKYVDGWFRTGDVVTQTESGILTLVGRNEDRINRGGFKFYPAEIEDAALEHPAVAEAAAIGVDHPTLGQDAVLFVVAKADQELTVADMRSFLGQRIARNKVPSQVLFRDALPRNSYGKVVRRQLVDDYSAHLGETTHLVR